MVYQVSSLGSSMDSPENQALPPDSMAVNAATLEERNTPTNNLEKRQLSSNTQDSDTEVSGLDLVRTAFVKNISISATLEIYFLIA